MMQKKNYEYGYLDGVMEDYYPTSKKIRSRGPYISIEKFEKKTKVLKIEKERNFTTTCIKEKIWNDMNQNVIWFGIFGPSRISLKDGTWEYFNEEGKLKTRVHFKKGGKVVTNL